MKAHDSKALGGKASLGESAVVALANLKLKSLALFVRESGAVNSAFKAAKFRHVWGTLNGGWSGGEKFRAFR